MYYFAAACRLKWWLSVVLQFCYTGRMGLLGNLTTAQMVEQLVEARRWLLQYTQQQLPLKQRQHHGSSSDTQPRSSNSWPPVPPRINNIVFMGECLRHCCMRINLVPLQTQAAVNLVFFLFHRCKSTELFAVQTSQRCSISMNCLQQPLAFSSHGYSSKLEHIVPTSPAASICQLCCWQPASVPPPQF